jgi:hypothetical protein
MFLRVQPSQSFAFGSAHYSDFSSRSPASSGLLFLLAMRNWSQSISRSHLHRIFSPRYDEGTRPILMCGIYILVLFRRGSRRHPRVENKRHFNKAAVSLLTQSGIDRPERTVYCLVKWKDSMLVQKFPRPEGRCCQIGLHSRLLKRIIILGR